MFNGVIWNEEQLLLFHQNVQVFQGASNNSVCQCQRAIYFKRAHCELNTSLQHTANESQSEVHDRQHDKCLLFWGHYNVLTE